MRDKIREIEANIRQLQCSLSEMLSDAQVLGVHLREMAGTKVRPHSGEINILNGEVRENKMDKKEEYILFNRFVAACESQWRIGGKRYAYGEDKEWTDVVCGIVGNRWIGGNILKYAGETDNYKTLGELIPEVNFFKIAVYCFVWWLKEFKHPTTGVHLKEEHWDEFVKGFSEVIKGVVKGGGGVDRHVFVDLVESQIINEPTMDTFYLIVALSYKWWLAEQGNFTQEDEGDKF